MSHSDGEGRVGAGGVLTIDLGAIAANWKSVAARLRAGASVAAVVKADAYGLGLAPVARALWAAGCRRFFVALADEGIALRATLPEAEIGVFNGVDSGFACELVQARLAPVLNHLGEIDDWSRTAAAVGAALPAWLHVDTGITRLGLHDDEVAALAADPAPLKALRIAGIMSHLACAEQADHPLNALQRARFDAALARLGPAAGGGVLASLANSSGVFLGPDYHYDLARPGAALYGVSPRRSGPNPMAQVVGLKGKILQTRRIDTPRTVGYGATHRAERGRRIATVAVGYADGYLRSLSGSARAHVGQVPVQVVGRVSMDLITVDVTDAPETATRPGAFVDLIGPLHTVDDLAREAGTIGYEILTALGPRYARRYLGAAP